MIYLEMLYQVLIVSATKGRKGMPSPWQLLNCFHLYMYLAHQLQNKP